MGNVIKLSYALLDMLVKYLRPIISETLKMVSPNTGGDVERKHIYIYIYIYISAGPPGATRL